MDFFQHQERARRNTLWLLAYFFAAVVAVVLSIYLAAVGILFFAQSRQDVGVQLHWWQPELFAIITAATLLIIFSGSIYKTWAIGGSGENVAVALGGRQVPANTRELSERVLLNVVEEMALAAGTPVPPVYILEKEVGINAFAAGTSPQNAVIGITRGAVETMRRDELQGVIAHEFSHILNGDMRMNIRLMGWLHGILVIAMIGYLVLRTMSYTSSSSSRSSNNKKGEGGLALAFLVGGLALVVIGYVGVFFAQLIKAAVSRQREYLADASAVQFTRNPQGITNALKKIGGWKDHSKLSAPQAEESSHMFFGSAVSHIFATHPPLAQRIQRIDPAFSGEFATTLPIAHSPNEIIDPNSLTQRISGLAGPIEASLAAELREPLGAVATIYALLLAHEGSAERATQLEILNRTANVHVLSEFARVVSSVDQLATEQKLPVACKVLPALSQMSAPQIAEFQNTVHAIVRTDDRVTLFEFAVQRFVAKRLADRLGRQRASQAGRRSFEELREPFAVVLSALANHGSPSDASAAFEAGMLAASVSTSSGASLGQLLPDSDHWVEPLDRALDSLAAAAPSAKKQILAGITACIAYDGHMTVEETEMLRVAADALGVPMPQ